MATVDQRSTQHASVNDGPAYAFVGDTEETAERARDDVDLPLDPHHSPATRGARRG